MSDRDTVPEDVVAQAAAAWGEGLVSSEVAARFPEWPAGQLLKEMAGFLARYCAPKTQITLLIINRPLRAQTVRAAIDRYRGLIPVPLAVELAEREAMYFGADVAGAE